MDTTVESVLRRALLRIERMTDNPNPETVNRIRLVAASALEVAKTVGGVDYSGNHEADTAPKTETGD